MDNVISKGLPYLSKANIQGYLSNMIYRFAGNGAYWKQDYPNAIKYYVRYFTSNERESGTNYEEITNQLSVSYIFSGTHWGNAPLRNRVFEIKPKYHLFGHAHDAYGTEKQEGIVFSNGAILDDSYSKINKAHIFEITK